MNMPEKAEAALSVWGDPSCVIVDSSEEMGRGSTLINADFGVRSTFLRRSAACTKFELTAHWHRPPIQPAICAGILDRPIHTAGDVQRGPAPLCQADVVGVRGSSRRMVPG